MKFRIFFRFTTVMILYYISCCAIMGFAALFMQSRGFTNTETGLFFTCSSFLCIVQQMLYGVALDRFPRLSARHFLLGFGVISILLGILLSLTTKKRFFLYVIHYLIPAYLHPHPLSTLLALNLSMPGSLSILVWHEALVLFPMPAPPCFSAI